MSIVEQNPFVEFAPQEQMVPYVDLKNIANIPQKTIDKYGVTDFQKILIRNWEREYVGRVGALNSIAGRCIIFEKKDNIQFSITSSKSGGIEIKYPADTLTGQKSGRQTIHDKVHDFVQLHEAHLRYNIPNHSIIVGDLPSINKDYMAEAYEQLSAELDYLTMTKLSASTLASHKYEKTAGWDTSAADIGKDIKGALQHIVNDSGVNPNWARGSETPQYTIILPVKAQEYMEDIVVIDGSRQTIGDYLQNRYKFQTLYSRPPFEFHETWPGTTSMFVLPTFDPRVGKMYSFDGAGRVPNQYIKHDIEGLETNLLWWFNYNIGRDEKDLVANKSRRVIEVTGIIPV